MIEIQTNAQIYRTFFGTNGLLSGVLHFYCSNCLSGNHRFHLAKLSISIMLAVCTSDQQVSFGLIVLILALSTPSSKLSVAVHRFQERCHRHAVVLYNQQVVAIQVPLQWTSSYTYAEHITPFALLKHWTVVHKCVISAAMF